VLLCYRLSAALQYWDLSIDFLSSHIAALVTAIAGLMVVLPDPDDTKSFSAVSHCSETNVNGYGESSNEGTATRLAIRACISNGGVPDCCASDVKVSQD
jgi:hypothetical protein